MKNTVLKCSSLAWPSLTHVTSCNIVCLKLLAEGFRPSALREVTQFEFKARECEDASPNKKCQCLVL